MRLIDANELETQFRSTKIIEVFPEWEELSFQTKHKLVHYGKEVKRIVQSAPTVEATPVVHGRWEQGDFYDCGDVCSICDWDCAIDDCHWSYCPNCGAKMDGDGND